MLTRRRLWIVWALPLIGCVQVFAQASAPTPSRSDERAEEQEPGKVIEELERERAGEKPFNVLENEQLTGNWWGARNWLADKGIEFGLGLTTIYQQNFRGGLHTHHGHDVTGTADYELALDFERMGLWEGGLLYVLAESSWGHDIGLEKSGTLFGTNGDAYLGNVPIEASEVWYQQTFFDNKVRVKLGKMDLMVDFDTNAYANDETFQFLNPVLINMANIPFPLYPQGIMVAVQPVEWLYVQGAVADAQGRPGQTGFETFYHDECYTFSIFEMGLMPILKTPWGRMPGGYRFMLWYDPQPKPKFVEARRIPNKTDDVGFGVSLDQLLFKERPGDDADSQGLGVFFRYGYAHDDVNLVENFWSVGAQYRGLVPTRDDDVLGFGFAQNIIGGQATAVGLGDRESIYELYYNVAVFPWLGVTPDLQYIHRPGGDKSIPDSFAAGVRLQMSF